MNERENERVRARERKSERAIERERERERDNPDDRSCRKYYYIVEAWSFVIYTSHIHTKKTQKNLKKKKK